MSGRARPVAVGLVAAIACLSGARAEASPCCVSATAHGVGRLLMWEDWAVGMRTSMALGVGGWDTAGDFRAFGDTYAEQEWRQELWTLVGLVRRVELHARVPAVLTHRRAGSASETGGGLGDVQAGLRYEIVPFGGPPPVSGVATTLAVVAPTGRPLFSAHRPLGTDATGRGAWVVVAALALEQTRMPWFVQLEIGASLPLPMERGDLEVVQRFGPGLQIAPIGGVEVVPGSVVVSLTGYLSWEAPLTLDGRTVADSSHLDTGLGAAASWRVLPHWTLQVSAATGLFLDGLGANQPGRVTATVGVRYGHF